MNLQYIADHKGDVTGVFIPIQEWEALRKQLDLPKVDKDAFAKNIHRQELLESFEQMKSIRSKKMQKPNLNDFLDELKAL
jgi:hypothetical protein